MIKYEDMLKKIAVIFLLLLSVSVCLSEPLSRHCVKTILALSLVMLFMNPILRKKLFFARAILMSMMVFIFVMFMSCIYGGNFVAEITNYKFLMHYNALLVPACIVIFDSSASVKKVMYGMFLGLVVTDLYIFYQSFNGVFRPYSFLKWSVGAGTMLYVILIPAMAVFSLFKDLSVKERVFTSICLIMSILAFVCLNTRGAWLAVFPVIFLYIVYSMRSLQAKAVAVCCIAACIAVGLAFSSNFLHRVQSITIKTGQENSVTERYLMWESAFRMGLDNPIMGVGMGNYTEKYQTEYISPLAKEPHLRTAHSNFFQFFAETGIVGLSAYCGLLLTFFAWSWKQRKNSYAIIFFLSTLSLALYSITDYTFEAFPAMRVYWLLMGVCGAGVYIDSR